MGAMGNVTLADEVRVAAASRLVSGELRPEDDAQSGEGVQSSDVLSVGGRCWVGMEKRWWKAEQALLKRCRLPGDLNR